jgi:hypothetical protein
MMFGAADGDGSTAGDGGASDGTAGNGGNGPLAAVLGVTSVGCLGGAFPKFDAGFAGCQLDAGASGAVGDCAAAVLPVGVCPHAGATPPAAAPHTAASPTQRRMRTGSCTGFVNRYAGW